MSSRLRLEAKRTLRGLLYTFNVRTLLLCAIAAASVHISRAIGLTYQLEFSFIALGITFPLTFNITQAFTRRERAIMCLAELKASVVALYWMHRDWPQDDSYPDGSLGNNRTRWAADFAELCLEFLSSMEAYMRCNDGYESLSEIRLSARKNNVASLLLGNTRLHPAADLEQADLNQSFIRRVETIHSSLPGNSHLRAAYSCLNRMNVAHELLCWKAGYNKGGEGGMSRTSQYQRYLIAQMEQLRMIKLYRTPFMLRHCCSVLVNLGAIVCGPYFAHVGRCNASWTAYCPAPYIFAFIYGVFCMLLINVQNSAEMPFDGCGLDDVWMELSHEFNDVLDLDSVDLSTMDSACLDAARKRSKGARAK